MGVVFALGFLWVFLLIVGGIGIFTGAVMLIIRRVRKKKTQKKYRILQIIGIVFLSIGILIAAIPVLVGIILIVVVALGILQMAIEDRYFTKHVDTDIKIEVAEISTVNSNVYLGESFMFEDKMFCEVEGFHVAYKDEYRGDAVANLYDGVTELTVYEYLFPKECDLLCAERRIYCTKDKMDELVKKYNNECDFTYQYIFTSNASTIYKDMKINDDIFLGIINFDEKFVKGIEDKDLDYETEYHIVQTADVGNLNRNIYVDICDDGTVVVGNTSNPLSAKEDEKQSEWDKYIVTDPEAERLLREIGEKVRREKEERKK